MKKALTGILAAETSDGKQIEMTIVEKESDLGLSFNKRLFVLINSIKFGYFSKYNLTDKPENIDPKYFKGEGQIKNIVSLDQKKEIMSIKFFVKTNANKKQNKVWVLKFATEQLAIVWANKLDHLKLQTNMRKSTSLSKKSGNKSKSNLSPSKSDLKLQNVNQTVEKQAKSQLKTMTKNESKEFKQEKTMTQTYNNPLFRNNIVQETSNQDEAQQMEKRKLEQQLKQLARERKLKELERERQNQLQKQRQRQRQRQREKQQQRKQKEKRNKEMQRWRMKNQYEEQENQKEKILIEDEPETLHFFKDNSKPKKEESYTKIDMNKNKSKPKLKNVNYLDMVSKIVQSSEKGSKKDFQKAHDYIFEMQKMKVEQINEDKSKIMKRNQENPKLSSEYGWMYKYLVKQMQGEEYEVIKQFASYCQNILKEVVNEYELPERKRTLLPKYKKKQYHLYEIEDVEFKMAMLDLKDVFNEEEPGNRDRICDMTNVKLLENQFKNFLILYEGLEFQSSIRIPLVCLSQYKGFVALFKANSIFDKQGIPTGNLPKNIEVSLKILAQRCKSDYQTLKSKENTLLLKLNSKYYSELAAEIGKGHLNFEYHIIQEIKYLMPPDFLHQRKNLNSKLPQEQNTAFLRSQLLKNYLDEHQNIQSILLMSLKREKVSAKLPKAIRNTQNANAKLEQLSQNVLASITTVIREFDEMNFYFMHPTELSNFLHRRGINIKYLGYLYEYCSLPFTKSCLISEIAARSCKILLRKTIQDLHLENNSFENVQNLNQTIIDRIIDFLNCVLGNSIETVTIWKVLSAHSERYFNASLKPDSVQKGVFIISLVYQCGITVDWTKINVNDVFQTPSFFNPDNLIEIKAKTKSLPPIIHEEEEVLLKYIEKQDPSVYLQFIRKYELDHKKIPQHIKKSEYYPKILKYIANFIPPQVFQPRQSTFSHLKLYEYEGCPTRNEVDRQLLELKWFLRKRKKEKYIKVCNSLLTKITSFFGDFHPLLSQLYETFSIFHRNNGEYEDSITFCKSSVVNMLKICGNNHIKIGEAYYQLGLCCIKSGKKQQAILNLKKAKNIFQVNKKTDTVSYAFITLKLGLLFLSENKIKEAENIVEYSIQILQKMAMEEGQFQGDIIEGYQILARCYEIQRSKAQEKELGKLCASKLKSINSSQNLQKMIKISTYPILNSLNFQKASIYLDIIAQLPIEISTDSYIKSYQLLKRRIIEDSLIENLKSYVDNLQHIENYLAENQTLGEWIPLNEIYERQTVSDFISLSEEMIYFLGEGFMKGTLQENL